MSAYYSEGIIVSSVPLPNNSDTDRTAVDLNSKQSGDGTEGTADRLNRASRLKAFNAFYDEFFIEPDPDPRTESLIRCMCKVSWDAGVIWFYRGA